MRRRLRGTSFAGLANGLPAFPPFTHAVLAVASGAPELPVVGFSSASRLRGPINRASPSVAGSTRVTRALGQREMARDRRNVLAMILLPPDRGRTIMNRYHDAEASFELSSKAPSGSL
jgi:hypothetical protein